MSARLRRLKKLESKVHGDEFIVTAANGARVALSVRDPLSMILAGFDRQYRALTGEPDRASRYDTILDILAGSVAAEDLPGQGSLVSIARDSAQDARRERATGETRQALEALENKKQESKPL